MPDVSSNNKKPDLPPPSGDPNQAEKYINQLVELIDTDRLDVAHTDLSKFDPSSLQDHYSLELDQYKVEVSHSKQPASGNDSYVILFTNIKNLTDGNCEKIILAYMHLSDNQFADFKNASLQQLERRRKAEEEKRLKEAMSPIDQALGNLTGSDSESTKDDVVTPSDTEDAEHLSTDTVQENHSDASTALAT